MDNTVRELDLTESRIQFPESVFRESSPEPFMYLSIHLSIYLSYPILSFYLSIYISRVGFNRRFSQQNLLMIMLLGRILTSSLLDWMRLNTSTRSINCILHCWMLSHSSPWKAMAAIALCLPVSGPHPFGGVHGIAGRPKGGCWGYKQWHRNEHHQNL